MQLRYFPVADDLRDYFGAYYIFECEPPVYQPICAELGNLRFILSGDSKMHWPDGRSTDFPKASITGPTMSAFALEALGNSRAFGVGILPFGWDALFGFSAERLLDRMDDLESYLGQEARDFHDQLRSASDEQMVAAADEFLRRQVEKRKDDIKRFPAPLEEWLLQPDAEGLDRLLEMMDVSHRQIDRLAKYYFGASPKALQRKYRALLALTRISLGEAENWADAGGDLYYDQSHFIREFKHFVGATPQDFIRNRPVLLAKSIELRARAMHKKPNTEQ
jgi:AraC-like DNA-binding protein